MGPHIGGMALIQKHPNFSSNIFSHVDLFSGYNSVNGPFDMQLALG